MRDTFRFILWAGAFLAFVAASAASGAQSELPLPWPVAPLTKSQVDAVKQCDLAALQKQRYPESVKVDALESAFEVQSDCDRAVLALAYAARLPDNEPLPERDRKAYSQAVSRNIGFALKAPLFYGYVDQVPLVKAPPVAALEVTHIKIQYKWVGLGLEQDYSLEIQQANSSPDVRVTTGAASSVKAPADKKVLQELGAALTDLVPVPSVFRLTPCTDNNPNWSIVMTYSDKTTVQLKTDSNLISIGGPWFVVIGDQTYIQLSSGILKALSGMIREMKLPLGQPAGTTCFGGGPAFFFEKAYP